MTTATLPKSKFSIDSVPQEAFKEFGEADAALRNGYKHFLNGFRLAAEGVANEYGGFDNLEAPKDQKEVFRIVKEVARKATKLSPKTFERYCKIARYCIIYHAEWDIAAEATRDDLRWIKVRRNAFKTGTLEERTRRAWDERQKLNVEEAKKKAEAEAKWLEENGSKEPEPTLIQFPAPEEYESEDAYWIAYLEAQVKHINKHMELLNGNSEVKTVVTNFYGAALPIVKKNKAQPMPAAAKVTKE